MITTSSCMPIMDSTIAPRCVLKLLTLHSNTTSLCVEQTSPHADVSTSKPSDPLFEFFPGRLDHWVGTETVPKLVARSE